MSLSLQLGYPDVPKSITNPNVQPKDALDNNGPIPFLTFIKLINVSFEPDSLQSYYNQYIKKWNSLSTSENEDDNILIVNRYKDFLKDISLNHTTPEEKNFLSKIDFDDPYDLDVAISFYGRKLREIATFYNDKRNRLKFNLVVNKLRGTNFGSERIISELLISYLKNLDGGRMLYDYDSIKNSLEVEIEELYDTYPYYFNQKPDDQKYDNKDLDYGYNIFLTDDKALIATYLSDVSEELKIIKESDELFDNRRLLTQKYLSTDFYYLSTSNTTSEFLSGKLFTSNDNRSNFFNRNFPTTASTELYDYLETSQERGFFKPSNTAILLVDGINSSYSFVLSSLSPNSLYFFPDPSKLGTNGEVLTFVVDDSYLKKNFSSGNANNQPTTSQYDSKYYGYVSKIEPNTQKYLDSIFDEGFVDDSKRDIYNNLYGVFRNDFRHKKIVENIAEEEILNLIVNGGEFYDTFFNEGSAFDYQTVDYSTYLQTFRSGLSTFTGSFSSNDADISFYFGQYSPYNELILPTEYNLVKTYEIIEGAYISKSDYTNYDDAISSDLSAFETSVGDFYYDYLIDGGLSETSTVRALLDPLFPTLTGNLTNSTRVSSIDVVDGDNFAAPFDFVFDLGSVEYAFNGLTNQPTEISDISTPDISDYPNYETSGIIMVRNSSTRQAKTLLNTIPYITTKYDSGVIDELDSNIIDFDISNDVIFLETPSYLVIERILFENGDFTNPKTSPIHIQHSSDEYDKVSNRYKIGNDVYYCKLKTLTPTISSNNFSIYPEIYKFDTINLKNSLIFPKTQSDITELFEIDGGDVRYIKSDTPRLTYKSRNNTFNISYMMKDQNDLMVLHGLDFYLNPDVVFLAHNIHKTGSSAYSNILNSEYVSNLNVFLSGGYVENQEEEFIL